MKRQVFFIILLVSLAFSACGTEPDSAESLIAYFLDVGQAKSTLVVCWGQAMLIDGGNASDSDFIYTFLKKQGITRLDYVVATRAHSDYVGGLAGALNYTRADVIFCPVTTYDTSAFESFLRYISEQGKTITVPKAGDKFMLGGAEVLVLGSVFPADGANHTNDDSIVLRVVYGKTISV